MTVVRGDPDAVEKSLIIGVERNDIPSGDEVLRNIDFVVIIVERISRRRSLRDKGAVDIQLVIVIGGNGKDGGVRCFA